MTRRPKHVRVWYRGLPYRLDLVACRRGMVNRQVEGKLDSMEALAEAIGISRSTASRFFSGRPTSLAVTLKILEALNLKFEDVATPEEDGDGSDDAGATSRGRPEPRRSPAGMSFPLDGGFAS